MTWPVVVSLYALQLGKRRGRALPFKNLLPRPCRIARGSLSRNSCGKRRLRSWSISSHGGRGIAPLARQLNPDLVASEFCRLKTVSPGQEHILNTTNFGTAVSWLVSTLQRLYRAAQSFWGLIFSEAFPPKFFTLKTSTRDGESYSINGSTYLCDLFGQNRYAHPK
jgi:hypothetical protein